VSVDPPRVERLSWTLLEVCLAQLLQMGLGHEVALARAVRLLTQLQHRN
jgi:hypothetical protein